MHCTRHMAFLHMCALRASLHATRTPVLSRVPRASNQDSVPATQLLRGSFMSDGWAAGVTGSQPGPGRGTRENRVDVSSECDLAVDGGGGTRGVRSQGCKDPATGPSASGMWSQGGRQEQAGAVASGPPLLGPTGSPTLSALSLSTAPEQGSCCGSSTALSRAAPPPAPSVAGGEGGVTGALFWAITSKVEN